MKSKRQRKRNEETQPESHPNKQEQPPIKIKFNLSHDSIACFIGDKKSNKKKCTKGSASLRKIKGRQPSVENKKEPKKEEKSTSMAIKQTDS